MLSGFYWDNLIVLPMRYRKLRYIYAMRPLPCAINIALICHQYAINIRTCYGYATNMLLCKCYRHVIDVLIMRYLYAPPPHHQRINKLNRYSMNTRSRCNRWIIILLSACYPPATNMLPIYCDSPLCATNVQSAWYQWSSCVPCYRGNAINKLSQLY